MRTRCRIGHPLATVDVLADGRCTTRVGAQPVRRSSKMQAAVELLASLPAWRRRSSRTTAHVEIIGDLEAVHTASSVDAATAAEMGRITRGLREPTPQVPRPWASLHSRGVGALWAAVEQLEHAIKEYDAP